MTQSRPSIRRRTFLAGTVASAGVIAGGGSAWAGNPSATLTPASVGFHGIHQAGIVQDAQPASAFASFDVTARDQAELGQLMHRLTDRA